MHGGGGVKAGVEEKLPSHTPPCLGMVNPPQVWLTPQHTPGMAYHRSFAN